MQLDMPCFGFSWMLLKLVPLWLKTFSVNKIRFYKVTRYLNVGPLLSLLISKLCYYINKNLIRFAYNIII